MSKGRITRAFFTDCNRVLITSHDGGFVRRWDVESGELLLEAQVHEDAIQDMQVRVVLGSVMTSRAMT